MQLTNFEISGALNVFECMWALYAGRLQCHGKFAWPLNKASHCLPECPAQRPRASQLQDMCDSFTFPPLRQPLSCCRQRQATWSGGRETQLPSRLCSPSRGLSWPALYPSLTLTNQLLRCLSGTSLQSPPNLLAVRVGFHQCRWCASPMEARCRCTLTSLLTPLLASSAESLCESCLTAR